MYGRRLGVAIARLGATSLWVDYVPSESNIADTPSRFHEMTKAEIDKAAEELGGLVSMKIPAFTGPDGDWLSSTAIAASVWG